MDKEINSHLERNRNTLAETSLAVNRASEELTRYKDLLGNLATKYPGRNGDLFHPHDVKALEQRIEQSRRALESKNYADAVKIATAVTSIISPRSGALLDYPGAEGRFAELSKRIEAAHRSEFAVSAADEIRVFEQNVSNAQRAWSGANPDYAMLLQQSEKSVAALIRR